MSKNSLSSITFYSHFGNGDIFNSRSIVGEIIGKNPTLDFYYAHAKDPEILADIPIKQIKVESFMEMRKPFVLGQNKDLYINTWIGQDGGYLRTGLGIHLDSYVRMFNNTLKNFDLHLLDESSLEKYIPVIKFDMLNDKYLTNIEKFLRDTQGRKKIIISNGDVWSNQAKNFDFTPVIEQLTDEFKEIVFIATEKRAIEKDNLFFTKDIIKKNGSDLLEIAWMSIFCNMVIGRSSGPYVFTQIKENYLSEHFTFLSFTYHPNTSDLCHLMTLPCNRKWSGAVNPNAVYMKCKEEIEWALKH